jgi:hypothetical protein
MPVIGCLSNRSPDTDAKLLFSFHQSLSADSFAEGRDVALENRYAATATAKPQPFEHGRKDAGRKGQASLAMYSMYLDHQRRRLKEDAT